ncbi:MAG: helix-turn-helix domain-containing protein [Planctomycetota bacterium]|jgi:transcriptional regulator with XRE-family HTH domain
MKTFDAKKTGQKIKYHMETKGIKQKQLAELIGVTNATMSRKLNGKVPLTLEETVNISCCLEISIDILVENSGFSNEIIPRCPYLNTGALPIPKYRNEEPVSYTE